jgi:hypothetical protein
MDERHPNVGKGIRDTKTLSEDLEKELRSAINEFKKSQGYEVKD